MTFRESGTVELKRIVVDDIKKQIIAFANCDDGKLYIGIEDDGTVIGLDDADQTVFVNELVKLFLLLLKRRRKPQSGPRPISYHRRSSRKYPIYRL